MNIFKPRLRLVKGTRFVSFLFIGCSILIAAGILFAANMYYNIDTGEIVMEEIQRTTGLIRAIGGVIIGGTSTSTLPAGVALEIATSSDVLLSGENQLLRFSGGHPSYYTGFQATTSLTTSTVYVWPGTFPGVEGRYLTVDPNTGEMSWDFPAGAGTITAVGDVSGGSSFTSDLGTSYGTTLWFHPNASYLGALTVDPSLSSNATYTLPAIFGTNYLTLTATSTLANTGVLFADALGRLTQDNNFTFTTSTRTLALGASGTADGILRLYGGTSGYVEFLATSTGSGITYTWPQTAQTAGSDLFLTTDSSGNLRWLDIPGGGGVLGNGAADQVAFWTGASTISGTSSFAWNGSRLTLGDTAGLVTKLVEYTGGDLELRTNTSGDIFLNPASGIVQLATSTYIRTHGGYEIGTAGTEILREMIPIMGFDLPVQTATTSYIQVSRTLEDYPFSTAATGTERIHKLVFRYAASTTAAINTRIATTTGAYPSFTLPIPETANLDKGEAYIVETTIPDDNTAWWLQVQTVNAADTVRIFQIFLAAYDEIQ